MECVGDSQRAETRFQPVDVIWIIDRSGSMRGEADIVQQNINSFADAIGRSGVDYHGVMISSMGFVTVPPPLGVDAARFLYVEENVQSHDGLTVPLNRFADYAGFTTETAS